MVATAKPTKKVVENKKKSAGSRKYKTDADIKRALGTIKRAGKSRLQKFHAKRTQTQQEGRFPRSYLVQRGRTPIRFVKNKNASKTPKLRSSLQPGTVLILLAGVHKGKRVVLLKILKSGLLLVTGPHKWNGVPVRRVSPAYVIATKLQFDISSVKVPDVLDDSFFSRVVLREKKKDATEQMFATEKKTYTVSDERKKHQKAIDGQLLKVIKKHQDVKIIKRYLRTLFCLEKRDYPHKMIF